MASMRSALQPPCVGSGQLIRMRRIGPMVRICSTPDTVNGEPGDDSFFLFQKQLQFFCSISSIRSMRINRPETPLPRTGTEPQHRSQV